MPLVSRGQIDATILHDRPLFGHLSLIVHDIGARGALLTPIQPVLLFYGYQHGQLTYI
jgi:hypothetical protein